MKKIVSFFIITLVLSLTGCKKKEKTDFFVDFQAAGKLNLSLIADSARIFELEENDSCLLGSMELELCIDRDKLYIFDKKTASVFVYTLEGRLINKISRQGEGPEEYTSLDCFYAKDGIVYIKDYITIYHYTPAGDFIKKEVLPDKQYPIDFIPVSSGYMVLYKPRHPYYKNGIYLLSLLTGEIKQVVKPVKTYLYDSRGPYNFCHLKNGSYGYVDYFNGHIYHFTAETASVAHTFSLSKKTSEEALQTYSPDPSVYVNDIMCYMENETMLFFLTFENGKFHTTVYNKKTKETRNGFSLPAQGYFNDDLGGTIWMGFPYYHDNKLYVPVESNDPEKRVIQVVYLK